MDFTLNALVSFSKTESCILGLKPLRSDRAQPAVPRMLLVANGGWVRSQVGVGL